MRTSSGLFMCSYASSSTRCDSVAENSIDWRRSGGGRRRRMKRISAMKPRSNMRSASSSTSDLRVAHVEHVLLEVVDDAAGRADQHVDAVLQLSRCFS